MNYASTKDCGSIEKKIKLSLRNDNLSFQHHKVIAIDALDDKQRTELLRQAESEDLTTKGLTEVRDKLLGRAVKPAIPEPKPVSDMAAPAMSETQSEAGQVKSDAPEPASYDAQFAANKESTDLEQANKKIDQLESDNGELIKENAELTTKVGELEKDAEKKHKKYFKLMLENDELKRELSPNAMKIKIEMANRPAKDSKPKPAAKTKTKPAKISVSKGIEEITGKSGGNLKAKLTADAMAALGLTGKARYLPDADKARLLDWIKENN